MGATGENPAGGRAGTPACGAALVQSRWVRNARILPVGSGLRGVMPLPVQRRWRGEFSPGDRRDRPADRGRRPGVSPPAAKSSTTRGAKALASEPVRRRCRTGKSCSRGIPRASVFVGGNRGAGWATTRLHANGVSAGRQERTTAACGVTAATDVSGSAKASANLGTAVDAGLAARCPSVIVRAFEIRQWGSVLRVGAGSSSAEAGEGARRGRCKAVATPFAA